MSLRNGAISITVAISAMLWAGQNGIRPRPTPDDYPAREKATGFTLAAAVLTPEQVKKRFATDLNRGYLVVEVAVYPDPGHEVAMAARDFLAHFGSATETERPLTPQVIAARLGKKDKTADPPSVPAKVQVYNTETIGYERGPYGRSGVYVGSGTTVAVGGPPPGAPPPSQPSGMDRTSIEFELDDAALPERKISEETAGYLYFEKPKGRISTLNLTYYGEQGQIHLKIPVTPVK